MFVAFSEKDRAFNVGGITVKQAGLLYAALGVARKEIVTKYKDDGFVAEYSDLAIPVLEAKKFYEELSLILIETRDVAVNIVKSKNKRKEVEDEIQDCGSCDSCDNCHFKDLCEEL